MQTGRSGSASRFESAPPRNFILPAILLLISERPGYGYELVPRLQDLGLDHADRPGVYRALAQLEQDGLVVPSSQNPTAGQARRVYRITPLGERMLRGWMGVVKQEHDHLQRVLRRYQATGTIDSVLAEVEGGWSSALGLGWSAISPTSPTYRWLDPVAEWDSNHDPPVAGVDEEVGRVQPIRPDLETRRFTLLPDRSAVLIEVRSTVGPLSFGAMGVTGSVEAPVTGGRLRPDGPRSAALEVDMTGLRSGNSLYDAELLRRIEARRYPTARVELVDATECVPGGADGRYLLTGRLTFHRVTRTVQGTIRVEAGPGDHVVVKGEQVFDIRDFAIPSPTVLMLRIYPDVRVRLHAEAAPEPLS